MTVRVNIESSQANTVKNPAMRHPAPEIVFTKYLIMVRTLYLNSRQLLFLGAKHC